MSAVVLIIALLIAGASMIVGAMWLLAGFAWALLLCGALLIFVAIALRKGMTNG